MKKTFDCVEMKRQGAARVYEEIKDMTLEEELEYWRRATEVLRKQIEVAKAKAQEPVH